MQRNHLVGLTNHTGLELQKSESGGSPQLQHELGSGHGWPWPALGVAC